MDKFEFQNWFDYHSSAFVSVRNYYQNLDESDRSRNLDHWYRILRSIPLDKAKLATDQLFENDEFHPRRIDQHPGRIMRAVVGFKGSQVDALSWIKEFESMTAEDKAERKRRNREVIGLLHKLMDGKITKADYAKLAEKWDRKYPGQGWDVVVREFSPHIVPECVQDEDEIPF